MKMEKKVDILCVSPHPDDIEFACSGTIARLIKEGKKVAYLLCTSGDKGTSDFTIKPEVLSKMREKESQAAAKVLGVTDVMFLRFPDQGLEDTAQFRKEIVRGIRIYKPETVFCPDPYRKYLWHRDHRITGVVTLDAVYPYARDHLAYPDLIEQGYMPHKVREVYCWAPDDNANHWSDITTTIETKLAALKCHESQVGDHFEETEAWVRQRAADAAKGRKFKLAEAFHYVDVYY